jgi:hypothetical protein
MAASRPVLPVTGAAGSSIVSGQAKKKNGIKNGGVQV